LRPERPDSVMWACTSGSFVFGFGGALEQTAKVAALLGIPVSSTSIAFAEACTALDVRRVAVAATYPDDVARHFVEFLGKAGVEVLRMSAEGIITAAEVGTFGRDRVIELVTANDHPDAEAILVPDTALHSVAWLDDLEAAAGKPVLTANQVTVWEGLRIAGHTAGHDGLGRLFRQQGVR
jgi:maleate cis-trans isomerase